MTGDLIGFVRGAFVGLSGVGPGSLSQFGSFSLVVLDFLLDCGDFMPWRGCSWDWIEWFLFFSVLYSISTSVLGVGSQEE